ncbi:MAG: M3 family metallopeptidase [Vicinamibacterales bacterium]
MTKLTIAIVVLLSAGCSSAVDDGSKGVATVSDDNPFYTESTQPYQLPPFDRIDESHFLPAFERGMAEQLAEVSAISGQSTPPTFENTFVPLERSGVLLNRVAATFFNLSSADTNEALDQIRAEVAPKLASHTDQILLNGRLFERVRSLYEQRETLGLNDESLRLVERHYVDFVRAGALLSEADQQRMQEINGEMAALQTTFTQNVLDGVNAAAIVVDDHEQLAGLPEGQVAAAAAAANSRGLDGKYVIALLNTSGQPPLSSLDDRSLRERIMRESLARGSEDGEYDNREVITRLAELRAERAVMLGYPNHAAYILDEQTAQTVTAVNERLASLVPPAVANANREAADLQAMASADTGDVELAAWDWSYYAEKVRAARYDFDASELRPYFEIDAVIEKGVFYAATQLYGITFESRPDLTAYHPDVRVWEVFDHDGTPRGLFLGDFYARPSKRGGAWMSAYVTQSQLLDTTPVIANHLNITKPVNGEPTLLTFDEVETMFHEFGHALHGFFSDVEYPYFAGTAVPRDFVEYPSQVNEMWAKWPEVLANYAIHYETGEPMPKVLLDKVLEAAAFNQGFATTEYLAASLLDQAWHQLTADEVPAPQDVATFEASALQEAGVGLAVVPPRYRSTYFSHIWGSGYSAGYYSYIWAEVLDADSVEWFKENGGLRRENGDHFRRTLLSKGGSVDAMDLFRAFRGTEPNIEPLLVRRGLN